MGYKKYQLREDRSWSPKNTQSEDFVDTKGAKLSKKTLIVNQSNLEEIDLDSLLLIKVQIRGSTAVIQKHDLFKLIHQKKLTSEYQAWLECQGKKD